MNRFDVVIFDWDGTLMDSVAQIVDCLLSTANEFDFPLTTKQAQDIIGLSLPTAMRVLFPAQTEEMYQTLVDTYGKYFTISTQNPSLTATLFDGVPELCTALKLKGMRLAIATGKSRAGLDRVLNTLPLQNDFDITRCADETASKPNPLMLEEIVAFMGVDVSRCVMVGDSTYDLQMAKNLGMQSIGVTYGVHDADALNACQPLAIVHSVDALSAMLLSKL